MESINTILGIVASVLGIISTVISLKTKNEVKKMLQNSNNSQVIGNNSNKNEQRIGNGR